MAKTDRKSIFLAMPFKKEFNDLSEVVRKAAKHLDMDVKRVDQEPFTGPIISEIADDIENADVVVAVVTDENGNVYYEIGLAHCQRKPVVLLTSKPGNMLFDIQHHRALVYEESAPEGILEDLVRTLNAATRDFRFPHDHVANVFAPTTRNEKEAYYKGLDILLQTIAKTADLEGPLEVLHQRISKEHNELIMTVRDSIKQVVHVIVDVNGRIRRLRKE